MTTETTDNTWRFDYHAAGFDSMEQWLFVAIMSGQEFTDKFDTLSALTNKFTDVQLDVRINNVQIDAEPFFRRMIDSIESEAKHIAKREVGALMRNEHFDKLDEAMRDMEQAVKRELRRAARASGIELDSEDW